MQRIHWWFVSVVGVSSRGRCCSAILAQTGERGNDTFQFAHVTLSEESRTRRAHSSASLYGDSNTTSLLKIKWREAVKRPPAQGERERKTFQVHVC